MTSFWFILISMSLILAVYAQQARKSHKRPKMVGGDQVNTDDVPFIVSIKNVPFDYHKCAGFLVSERHIVTTAACLYPVSKGMAQAYLHPIMLSNVEERYDLVDWVIHTNFSIVPHENDIAVATLDKPVKGIGKDKIPDIARWPSLPKAAQVTSYGWGYIKLENNRYGNYTLHSVNLKILSNAMCSLLLREYLQCDSLCASSKIPFANSAADVGTPLIYKHNSTDYAVGLLTRSTEKLTPVTTFASLYEYRDFILDVIQGEEQEKPMVMTIMTSTTTTTTTPEHEESEEVEQESKSDVESDEATEQATTEKKDYDEYYDDYEYYSDEDDYSGRAVEVEDSDDSEPERQINAGHKRSHAPYRRSKRHPRPMTNK